MIPEFEQGISLGRDTGFLFPFFLSLHVKAYTTLHHWQSKIASHKSTHPRALQLRRQDNETLLLIILVRLIVVVKADRVKRHNSEGGMLPLPLG